MGATVEKSAVLTKVARGGDNTGTGEDRMLLRRTA